MRYELVPAGRFFFNLQTGQKGREVSWGEENSWLLFLSWFSSSGITDLFQTFFFICPNPELTGMLLCTFLNAPNVYDFLCKEPELENKNRRVLKEEGSGRWLEWGPEGHRWEMGGECLLGGECGEMEDTHGSCYYGCYAFHAWLSCSNFMAQTRSIQSLILLQQKKKKTAWGPKVLPY